MTSGRNDQRDQCRQPQERQAEQARQRDLVQDAEEDEGAGHREIGDERDRQRCAGDHGEADEEAAPAYAAAMREEQADADQEQEARRDAARKELPAAMRGHAGVEIAEEFEVPGEVVDRHGDQRGAARQVDRLDARQFWRDRGAGDAGSSDMALCCRASRASASGGSALGPAPPKRWPASQSGAARVGFLLSAPPARRQPCGNSRSPRPQWITQVRHPIWLPAVRPPGARTFASLYGLESFARASVSSSFRSRPTTCCRTSRRCRSSTRWCR